VSVREILAVNGLPDDRFASVAGKADVEPMFPDNPYPRREPARHHHLSTRRRRPRRVKP
jgi:hypothetical protein